MKFLKFLFLILWIFLPYLTVDGDTSSAPYPYKKICENEKFVFAMIPQWYLKYKYTHLSLPRRSGLYYRRKTPKGSFILHGLWTVNWYAKKVYLSPKGKYLIRMGSWASSPKQLGIAFYKSGRLLKKYTIQDLVSNYKKLPRSISHFRWKRKIYFFRDRTKLSLITLEGKEYIFDVHTGKIIYQKKIDFSSPSKWKKKAKEESKGSKKTSTIQKKTKVSSPSPTKKASSFRNFVFILLGVFVVLLILMIGIIVFRT